MKRMLINATQPEELRVALVDGQRLYDLDIESGAREQKKANIYRGKITRLEPSLEAAFVDFGADRHGFLPLKEISREYFSKEPSGRPNIKEVLKEGQEVIVQVDKEERGNKGAALTTFISLAGRFLVLMPNNPRAGGISRRIEGEERTQLKEAMNQLTLPDKMGVIVRTAGIGRSSEELQWDLDYLVQVWEAITTEAVKRPAPFLIYRESNVIIRAMRDYLRQDIGEVLIDSESVHEEALAFIRQVMPSYQQKIKLYTDDVPLFSRFQIESQIETAYQREVKLPSGGSVVIDHTEALVSIDINSARATRGADIEETALQTNVEAADEIARQLRLRDIGGLVVIDFIDMSPARNQREVENRVRDALKLDRARVQIGRISRFGLMEMSRQRLRPSLGETSGVVCPRCDGQGTIRDVRSMALSILRLIEEEAMKERSAQIRAILPVPVATYLLNEKRNVLSDVERRQDVRVVLLPNPELDTPHYDVQRFRDDHVLEEGEEQKSSYELSLESEAFKEPETTLAKPIQRTQAAVQSVAHTAPAPDSLRQESEAAESAPAKPAEAPTQPSADSTSDSQTPSGTANGGLIQLFRGLFGRRRHDEEPSQSTAATSQQSRGSHEREPETSTNGNQGRNGGSRQNRSDGQRGDGNSRRGENGNRQNDSGNRQSEGANRQSENGRQSECGNRQTEGGGRQSDGSNRQNGNRRRRSQDNRQGSDNRNSGDGRQGGGRQKGDSRQESEDRQSSASRSDANTSSKSNGRQETRGPKPDKANAGNKGGGNKGDGNKGDGNKNEGNKGERKPQTQPAPEVANDDSGVAATAVDTTPKRTRNNPRKRSRQHALNPSAVEQQQRLEAEAAKAPETSATSEAPAQDESAASETVNASQPKTAKAQASETVKGQTTSTDDQTVTPKASDSAATSTPETQAAVPAAKTNSADSAQADKAAKPKRNAKPATAAPAETVGATESTEHPASATPRDQVRSATPADVGQAETQPEVAPREAPTSDSSVAASLEAANIDSEKSAAVPSPVASTQERKPEPASAEAAEPAPTTTDESSERHASPAPSTKALADVDKPASTTDDGAKAEVQPSVATKPATAARQDDNAVQREATSAPAAPKPHSSAEAGAVPHSAEGDKAAPTVNEAAPKADETTATPADASDAVEKDVAPKQPTSPSTVAQPAPAAPAPSASSPAKQDTVTAADSKAASERPAASPVSDESPSVEPTSPKRDESSSVEPSAKTDDEAASTTQATKPAAQRDAATAAKPDAASSSDASATRRRAHNDPREKRRRERGNSES
ncbi:ribonuclease E [Salinicola halophilus]|uniref:ribonuclease E n=1 Tax=Salinicola halophilus TaxID=184065 RepID=UPI000DA11177|nr:ribonuclease E [Salinicola halophilus]